MDRLVLFLEKYIRVLGGAASLLTVGMAHGRERGRLAELAEFFGWKNPEKSHLIHFPEVAIAELFPHGIEGLSLRDFEGRDGNVSPTELLVLSAWARTRAPRALFEFGTFDGRTTLHLALNAPSARLYTLDLPEEKVAGARKNPDGDTKFAGRVSVGHRYRNRPEAARITELRGDSMQFDFSPYARSMNLVFIDGAHSFPYVMSDTKHALAMLAPGGTLFWHDCRPSCGGVVRVLNEYYAQAPRFQNLRRVRGTNLAVWTSPV